VAAGGATVAQPASSAAVNRDKKGVARIRQSSNGIARL
jgi:hypothetical protein